MAYLQKYATYSSFNLLKYKISFSQAPLFQQGTEISVTHQGTEQQL
jgi:hypothetical protein